MLHDSLGLRAFPGTRRPKQHNRTHTPRGFLRHRLGQSLPTSISPTVVVDRRGAATPYEAFVETPLATSHPATTPAAIDVASYVFITSDVRGCVRSAE